MRLSLSVRFATPLALVLAVGIAVGGLSLPVHASAAEPAPADPSLAEMNAAHDHTMGSTVAKFEGAEAAPNALTASPDVFPPGLRGLDVSSWQSNINWSQVAANGAKFAYIKATESTGYRSGQFSQQYIGSYRAGLIRGAYHFAVPNVSSGAVQANFFVNNGGGWSADGKTLPPLLDIEYDPYTGTDHTNSCFGLTAAQMVAWILDFSNTVLARTGRVPAIYSTTNWWQTCTGNSRAFGNNPLFIARYPSQISYGAGTLPASWSSYSFWQFADAGIFPGDQDVFNGDYTALQSLAAPVPTVLTVPVSRVAGTDMYGTSAAASSSFSPNVPVAYVASGATYADALAGAAAAGANRGPVLLVQSTGIPAPVAAELSRLQPQRIVVLGGPAVVSEAVARALQAYTSGSVTRLSGVDRYATSAAISSTFAPGTSVAYVATGANFPDALSGAAVAAGSQTGPMLLVDGTSISPLVGDELARLKPGRIVVLGGQSAISAAVQQQLGAYTTGGVTRIAGTDRFGTSAAIASAFPANADVVYIAVGSNFPDALSGAPVAGIAGSPVLLVQHNGIPPAIASELKRLNPTRVVILGGPGAVSDALAKAL